jgi:hypothetical protein
MSHPITFILRSAAGFHSLARRPLLTQHRALSTIPDRSRSRSAQPKSPLPPVGVTAALAAADDPSTIPRPTIFDEFSIAGRVGLVTGGNGGLGLEMALALCEARARAVYCVDLPLTPSVEWERTRAYVQRMGGGVRLEYVSADVRDQEGIWEKVAQVGDREGRIDICVAAAAMLGSHIECLEYPSEHFKEVG